MGSVFHNIDTTDGVEVLTAKEDIRIIRMTIANTETADTAVNVDLYKNNQSGRTARIVGYNTTINGGDVLTLTDIILTATQYLTVDSDGAIDVDINYITI